MALWLALVATPASAHDTLVDSFPQEGETLTEVPEEIVLDYSGEISELGVQFMVTGPDGRDVTMGTPTVVGTTASQGLASELVDGDYVIAWRVTSSDGHPISGEIPFSLDAGTAPGEDDETTTAPTPTDDAEGTTAPGGGTDSGGATDDGTTATSTQAPGGDATDPAGDGEATDEAGDAPVIGSDSDIPAWGWVIAGLAAIGLVACGFLAFRRN